MVKIKVEELKYEDNNLKANLNSVLSNGEAVSAKIVIDTKDLKNFIHLNQDEVLDFFFISGFVYGIDRFIQRRPNSVDGWSRMLDVAFPVYDVNKWNLIKDDFESLLSFLTGDYWKVHFVKKSFRIPSENIVSQDYGQVNLFSGGLDSLIGAIDSLDTGSKPILFISHYDSKMGGPKKDQTAVGDALLDNYQNHFHRLPSVNVFLDSPGFKSETTSRSRSLLFIGLGLLVAAHKSLPIIVPENGTVSLNFPLSTSRRSSCSTRTTHPRVINQLKHIFNQLGILVDILNPYNHKTKGEMVHSCKDSSFLSNVVHLSNSCGKRGHRSHWDIKDATHCGVCMPCIYRRASLKGITDTTEYGSEINDLKFKTKKGQDVDALLYYLKAPIKDQQIKFELISNGMNDLTELYNYVEVVKRTRKELISWIDSVGNAGIKRRLL